jgi:putative transposase
MNQKEHHKKRSFKEEYLEILKKSEIVFEEKYLFEWFN